MKESSHRELFETLDRRARPEVVANLVLQVAKLSNAERQLVSKAAHYATHWSSMSSDFARPIDISRQLSLAGILFAADSDIDPSDMQAAAEYLTSAELEIGKKFGSNDFKKDRLPKAERIACGIDISKRQYNKRFRLMARMELKRHRIIREQLKRSLTLVSKNRLAKDLSPEHFADSNTACFIAYYVARCNMRSAFTNQSQVRPFDDICETLFNRCRFSPTTNWLAIAHVMPDADVLSHLSDSDRGSLLGKYFAVMQIAADLLREVWIRSNINREAMVVRRGNDSTTWNVTAGAWNKLRSGWFSLLFSLGLEDWEEAMCPGKVLRLMAADVAAWHRNSGGDLHADTGPWCDLPLPWEVLTGEPCSKARVIQVCEKWKVDPVRSGWIAPPPNRAVTRFSPTPELVHGVTVANPHLASLLRSIGAFSGKTGKMASDDNLLG